jgi:hypothetical protein
VRWRLSVKRSKSFNERNQTEKFNRGGKTAAPGGFKRRVEKMPTAKREMACVSQNWDASTISLSAGAQTGSSRWVAVSGVRIPHFEWPVSQPTETWPRKDLVSAVLPIGMGSRRCTRSSSSLRFDRSAGTRALFSNAPFAFSKSPWSTERRCTHPRLVRAFLPQYHS